MFIKLALLTAAYAMTVLNQPKTIDALVCRELTDMVEVVDILADGNDASIYLLARQKSHEGRCGVMQVEIEDGESAESIYSRPAGDFVNKVFYGELVDGSPVFILFIYKDNQDTSS